MTYLQKFAPSETKEVNMKVFNMTKRINEAKALVKHISCDCKCKFNSTACKSNEKRNNDKWQCECKKYRTCKKIIVRILACVFVRIVSI